MKRKKNKDLDKEDIKTYRKKMKRISKLIEKDRDWDYQFLLDLEDLKLSWMEKYYTETEPRPDILSDLKLARKLLYIVSGREDYDIEGLRAKWCNTRNATRFMAVPFKDGYTNPDYYKRALREEKAWHLYCILREYRLRSWWT
jgi:hypothetical protein